MADEKNKEGDIPEQPRVEPEIIPPDRSQPSSDWQRAQRSWQNTQQDNRRPNGFSRNSSQRIFVMRGGPIGFAVFVLALAAIIALIMVVALGAFLIWIPVFVVLLIVAAIFRFLR